MIDLPEVAIGAARAWHSLASRLPVAFDLDGGTMVLDRVPDGDPLSGTGAVAVTATLDGHPVGLRIDPGELPGEALRLVPELASLGLPDGLRGVMTEMLLAEWSDKIEEWCGQRPAWGPLGAAAEHSQSQRLMFRRAGRMIASLALDDAGLAWLADRLSHLPAHALTLDDVPVRLGLVLARLSMPAGEIGALRPGDVVLLDTFPVAANGALMVVIQPGGGPALTGQIARNQLELLAIMNGEIETTVPPVEGSFDDLPMTVEFLAGQLVLPLSRVRELSPGQVLDLGFDATTAVTVRINGQVAAEGELVRIAERTGVRIRDVFLARR